MGARKLLLVEDSEDLIEVWTSLFSMSGYEVTACLTCKAALDRIRLREHFDVVLSDYYLPDFNGLILFDHLRQLNPLTPFFLVTGTREPFIYEHIARGGRAEVISKPVQFKKLLEHVGNSLNTRADIHVV